jgi:hypothetical protein
VKSAQLAAAVDRVFPKTSPDPETIVHRLVAKHLLEQQGYKAFLSAASGPAKWDTFRDLCRTRSFKKFLESTKGFVVEGSAGSEAVALATDQLLHLSKQIKGASSSSRNASASSTSNTSAERAQLQELVTALWSIDSSDPAVRVKRCMADLLLDEPGLTLPQGAIGNVGIALGGAKKLGISGGIENVLTRDPSGCFVFKAVKKARFICLDATALCLYAQQQGIGYSSSVDEEGSSDDEGGSNGDGGNSNSEESMLEVRAPQHYTACRVLLNKHTPADDNCSS